jgi:hypothetical protein
MQRLIAVLLLTLLLLSCSSSYKFTKKINLNKKKFLLLLPVKTENIVNKNLLLNLNRLAVGEFRSRNIQILDPVFTETYLGSYEEISENKREKCRLIKKLYEKFPLAGVILLNFKNTFKSNFILGNVIRYEGSLEVLDSECEPLTKIERVLSRKSGLIFYTGQLVEAIRSSFSLSHEVETERLVSNLLNLLIDEFSKNINISKTEKKLSLKDLELAVKNITIAGAKNYSYQICISAPEEEEKVKAFINIDKARLSLIPNKDRLCTNVRKNLLFNAKNAEVELFSRYGNQLSMPLEINSYKVCKLESKLQEGKLVLRNISNDTLKCNNQKVIILTQSNQTIQVNPIRLSEVSKLPNSVVLDNRTKDKSSNYYLLIEKDGVVDFNIYEQIAVN